MPRTTSSALDTAIAATITSIGYLVFIDIPGLPIRLSNIGTQVWNGNTYDESDFQLSGISLNVDAPLSGATMRVQNYDNGAASILLGNAIANVPVTIYQFSRGTLGAADVPTIGTWEISGAEIGLDFATITLAPEKARKLFAPRKRVDPANGLAMATPAAAVVQWGTEIYVFGETA